jgi:hypothetical protein
VLSAEAAVVVVILDMEVGQEVAVPVVAVLDKIVMMVVQVTRFSLQVAVLVEVVLVQQVDQVYVS